MEGLVETVYVVHRVAKRNLRVILSAPKARQFVHSQRPIALELGTI